jgi:hypothetical protein
VEAVVLVESKETAFKEGLKEEKKVIWQVKWDTFIK